MIITLIKKERIYTTYLPLIVKGQFWITDDSGSEGGRKLLSIEGVDGKWFIRSRRSISIKDSNGVDVKFAAVISSIFYQLSMPEPEEPSLLFCEEITKEQLTFKKYMINNLSKTEIVIGRKPENSIYINNNKVSRPHCTITIDHGRWMIRCEGRGNGTFVNGYRVSSKPLKPGDSIYVFGATIIIGGNFIAINNLNDVTLDPKIFTAYLPETVETSKVDDTTEQYEEEMEYFYPTPRFKKELEKAQINIDAPPQSPIGEEMPLILVLGPAVTMAMMAVTMGGFMVLNAVATGNMLMAIPAVVMSSSMLLGAVLWPTLSRRHQKKKGLKEEGIRQEKYREYLRKMDELIQGECIKQEAILRDGSVSVAECIKRVEDRSIQLWERSAEQKDFLHLRVGVGDEVLYADINVPKETFSLKEDNLLKEVIALGNKPKKLKNVPISISLLDNYFTSVIGDRKRCIQFANGLIIQLTAHYGYDDVKLAFLYDEVERSEFEYTKWLPHTWTDDKSLRMIATNLNQLKEVSAYIEKEIEARTETSSFDKENATPYYVIFAFSLELALRSDVLKRLYSLEENINISVVTFFNELKNVPKECTAIIELIGENGRIFDKKDTSGKYIGFVNDISWTENLNSYSVKLANTFLDVSTSSYQLPKMVTFMEMFGVNKVEHLNVTQRWRENDPTKTLQAPIGVNTFGELFQLDLHEKFHGPHGLVAGTTGSGKSELIITYILSLALNYHPDEVAFILIDYKGGGMAKAFEELPHVAGIITNLDGSAINRSLVSINSELKKRQGIFNDASKQLETRIADIYAYQKEYRNGRVTEPIPHLFIISDEFAELKAQQPEFMSELVSTARIGRSLGVHLILATQKPSGVVDDQIWSNSKFKISLKVQDRSDSMEMLKRPDAAELSDTGRFYLLVGNNEVFEMGQSAWAGANYVPSEVDVTKEACTISVIDTTGQVIQSVKPEVKKVDESETKKQLDVITDYLSQTALEEKVSTRQLWLPPLDDVILLDELHERYPQSKENDFILNPLIGEVDDPARQQKFALNLPISKGGNTVIYGSAGSGKATFITTMIVDLIRNHTAEALNLYLLDFGAETLRAFKKAPQVGDVVFSDDSEKIVNLLKMLKKEVTNRKKMFADWGGDYNSYCERSGNLIPNIVIVINNYSNFKELYFDYEERIVSIIQESAKYGMFFILTVNNTNVSYRLSENCGNVFALQLNDQMDYSVIGRTDGLIPKKIKGRGLINKDGIYELQVAYATDSETIIEEIWKICEALGNISQKKAKSIPILPDVVNPEFFDNVNASLNDFPIGVNKVKLNVEYLQLESSYITLIAAEDVEKTIVLMQGMAELMSTKLDIDTTVLDAGCLFKTDVERRYTLSSHEVEKDILSLFEITLERFAAYKRKGQRDFENKIYIIPSISVLYKELSEESVDKLNALLSRGRANLGMNIIISDNSSDISLYSSEEWYRTYCNGNGIWIGDGVTGQFNLTISELTNELYEKIGGDYGVIIDKGKYKIIKILQSYLAEKEGGDDDYE